MNSVKALQSVLLAVSFGGLTAAGCIINVGPLDCSTCDSEPLCHNHLDTSTDTCYCDAGYEFANPNDANDFECDRIPPRPGDSNCNNPNNVQQGSECFCEDGYTWCSNDVNDLTCCIDPNQDSIGGTGVATEDPSESETAQTGTDTEPGTSTTGGTDPGTGTADPDSSGGQSELPPCDGNYEMLFFCTNANPNDPEGSSAFYCEGGNWSEVNADEQCAADGFDFSYGCAEVDGVSEFYCGDGPGTDCTDADDACVDAGSLNVCILGKLTARNCAEFCQDPNAKITFDTGYCDDTAIECVCCDNGDKGCPA